MNKTLIAILATIWMMAPAFAALTDLNATLDAKIKKLPALQKQAIKDNPKFREKMAEYLYHLQLADDDSLSGVIDRLFESSTQFLMCDDQADWECLEAKAVVQPKVAYRMDIKPDLGKPVVVPSPFKMSTYFTKRWAQRKAGLPANGPTVADILGQKITENAKDGLYLSIYGIDDADASMKPVFEAIAGRVKAGNVDIQAVVDIAKEGAPNSFFRNYDITMGDDGPEVSIYKLLDFDFSYVNPLDPEMWAFGRPTWMDTIQEYEHEAFKPEAGDKAARYLKDAAWIVKMEAGNTATRMSYQYKDTPRLLKLLNSGISDNAKARGHIEYPMEGIMHNKYAVMKNGNKMSLWTGTTNVARTCMGEENNSNMALFIESTELAQVFKEEFDEMFKHDATNKKLTENIPSLATGRFHTLKTVNTKRYFKYSDGTEVRAHFSPTDDGEHRAILPMLRTAQKGDLLRISMFGSGGIEGVRELQAAAARGVKIKIVLDNTTGSGNYSWIKDSEGNLMNENPYDPEKAEKIEIRLNNWPGLSHQKVATLTRKDGRVEVLIIGSQNWSLTGNDLNDENMLTIRHRTKNVVGGVEFNQDFDQNQFPNSLPIRLTADGKVEKFGGEVIGPGNLEGSEAQLQE
jgi:hypothetical protein